MVKSLRPGERPNMSGRIPVVSPQDFCCGACGAPADSRLALFTPHCLGGGPGREIPVTLRFTCAECGASTTFPVPAGWVPEGWEWYD